MINATNRNKRGREIELIRVTEAMFEQSTREQREGAVMRKECSRQRESMFMQGWHAVETGFKYFFIFTYKTQSIYHRPGIPLYVC